MPCPECGALSKSLKYRYRPRGIFLVVAASWSATGYVACPSCVRKDIGKNLLWLLLGFHVGSPIIFLIVEFPQLINSFFGGHCGKVRNIIDESELSEEEVQKRKKAKKKRENIIVAIIIVIALAVIAGIIITSA